MKRRHVPLRKCIVCSQMKAKHELLRMVKLQDGKMYLDELANISGKGGYICKNKGCLETAVNKKRIEKVFKTSLDNDFINDLNAKMEELDE